MRERRLASRLGFHGEGSTTTSTRPFGGDGEKAEAQKSAELLYPRVVLPTATPPGGADREPNFVAGGRAINGLKHQFEREGLFHLADHDEFG